MINAIPTKDASGAENGFLLPIWSSALSRYRPEQVYLTVVNPGCSKGPHLHQRRRGRFFCIKGDVEIIIREPGPYVIYRTGESFGFGCVEVMPGLAAMIRNIGTEPAYVLNMPDRPWTPEDQDEWPVEGWDYKP